MPEPLGTGVSNPSGSDAQNNGQADASNGVQQASQDSSSQTGEKSNAPADKTPANSGTDTAAANADTANNQSATNTTGKKEDEPGAKTPSADGKLRQQWGEQRKLLTSALVSENPKAALVQALRQNPDLATYFEKRYGLNVDAYEARPDGGVPKTDDNNKLLTMLGVPDGETAEGDPNTLSTEKTAKSMLSDLTRGILTITAKEIGVEYNLSEGEAKKLVDIASSVLQSNPFMEPEQAMTAAKISMLGAAKPKPPVVPNNTTGGGNAGGQAGDLQLLTVSEYASLTPLQMAQYEKKFAYKFKP